MAVVKYSFAYQNPEETGIIRIQKTILLEQQLMLNRALTNHSESEGWVPIFFFLLVTDR